MGFDDTANLFPGENVAPLIRFSDPKEFLRPRRFLGEAVLLLLSAQLGEG